LGITEGTVRNQVTILQDDHVLQTIGMVDPQRMVYDAPALVRVSIQPSYLEDVAEEIPAFEQLLAHIPEPDDAQRRKLVKDGLVYLASLGVTSVHNMDAVARQTASYAVLEDMGELTLRVYMLYNVLLETAVEELQREAVTLREQFQSEMVRTDATLTFGSNWPVAPADPIWGIVGAVNRKAWKPGHNSHNQTLAEAIASYTRNAAWAEFQEDQKGPIKVGMWADLVLLTDDIFTLPPEELIDVRVAMTLCNGWITWRSS